MSFKYTYIYICEQEKGLIYSCDVPSNVCLSEMHIVSEILSQFAIFKVHLPLQYQPLKPMLLNR